MTCQTYTFLSISALKVSKAFIFDKHTIQPPSSVFVAISVGIKAKVMSSIPSGEIIEEEIVCWVVASIVPWQRSRWV